jgi:GNAT superfamily N-acetyltransferase
MWLNPLVNRIPETVEIGTTRDDGLTMRRATLDDSGVIARHRVCMFRDMGDVSDGPVAEELFHASAQALEECFADGSYIGWLVADREGNVVAGGGVHIKPQMPRLLPDRSGVASCKVPLIVNVYTEPAWRRRGLARWITVAILQWARGEGIDRVILHASKHGRPLYETLGFLPTNEMRWEPPRGPQD